MVREGDYVSFDGLTGEVKIARVPSKPSEILQVLDGTLEAWESDIYKRFDKVLTWADKTITCSVTKVPLPTGVYAVTVSPQPYKMHPSLIITPGFAVKNPEIVLVSPDHGIPNTEVTVTGSFVSTKKGKVYLEYLDNGQTKKKNCKVTYWYMNPTDGASEIRFIVPKADSGSYTLKVTNKVGAAQTTFTVDPSP